MTATIKSFKDLVDWSYSGRLRLPAFQRNWRWRPDKVMKLFDSLRQKYPIGSLLFLSGAGENLGPKDFQGSNSPKGTAADFLVLDGQQRLTAGIHLFYATGATKYFIDLTTLYNLLQTKKVDVKNKEAVSEFCADLDTDDGYIVAKKVAVDPRSLLIDQHLLSTHILADVGALNQAIRDYTAKFPDKADFLFNVISPFFSLASTEGVPFIQIDQHTQIEAISRIFTTLNTTGKLLTPFELVVAILYPKNIDLVKEVQAFKNEGKYYPQMDKTGEILLQTIAMLADKDPKKSNLPKTITDTLYGVNKKEAFDKLEQLGKLLTERIGAGLETSGADLVPYDAIYAPMATALKYIEKNLSEPDRAAAEEKLVKWFVGAALSQRYQEGVHNKQKRDYALFTSWISGGAVPDWLQEVVVPNINRASFDGAIGKLVQCMINHGRPKDPLTTKHVGYHSGVLKPEKHHIFPSKWLPTGIKGWDKKIDSGDVIGNLLFIEPTTNKKWINFNPSDQFQDCVNTSGVHVTTDSYRVQFLDDDCISLINKNNKTKDDFLAFIEARTNAIRKRISEKYSFPLATNPVDEDIDEPEDV